MRSRRVWSRALVAVALVLGSAGAALGAGFAQVNPTPGQWDHLFAGVRSESMGQADLAASCGPFAVLDNPAPLLAGTGSGVGFAEVGYGKMEYLPWLALHQYGIAFEHRAFRLNATRLDLRSDPILIRTSYPPDGDGETFRADERLIVIAACVDVAALLAPYSAWEWTFGLGHRRQRFGTSGMVDHVWGADLGTSARYSHRLPDGSLAVSAAGVIRNLGHRDGQPYTSRFGVALKLAASAGGAAEFLALTLAATWVDDMSNSEYFKEGRHLGAELTLVQVLSARLGHDDQVFGGTSQYGFGLHVPDHWLGPVGLTIDWGSVDLGDVMEGETTSQMLSVTGSLHI